jgi:hypothetical protein
MTTSAKILAIQVLPTLADFLEDKQSFSKVV